MYPNRAERQAHSFPALLIGILLLALGLRTGLLLTRAALIENEGAGYARLAESLYFRHDYSGIAETPDLSSPPGYPILIAAAAFVTRNFVTGARLVSLISGMSLVWTFYHFGLHLYGRVAAILAALLVAIHPFLICLSVAAYSEGPYYAFLVAGMYWAVRSFDNATPKAWFWTAFCFGWAYLTRPEALPIPLLVVIPLILSRGRQGLRKVSTEALGLLAIFALFVIPYALFLQSHTGHFQFEARNLVNYTIGNRVLAGMDAYASSRGLGNNLNIEGPLLHTNPFAAYSPYPTDWPHVFRYLLRMANYNKYWVYDVFVHFAFGAPFLWCLVSLGLFDLPWDQRRLIFETFFLFVLAYVFVMLFAVHARQVRYGFPLVPLTLLWTAKGLETFCQWASATASRILKGGLVAKMAGPATAVVAFSTLVGLSTFGVSEIGEFQMGRPQHIIVRRAGEWLKQYAPGSKTIFSEGSVLPYYAGGYQLLTPWASPDVVLRYLHSENPDFLVLSSFSPPKLPYLVDWYQHGVPDSQAHLIHEESGPGGEVISIYSWAWQHHGQDAWP